MRLDVCPGFLRPLYTRGQADTLSVEGPIIHVLRNVLFLHFPGETLFFFQYSFLFLIGFVIPGYEMVYNPFTLSLNKHIGPWKHSQLN